MKVGDLVDAELLPEFIRWYIEATRPFEDDRLAYCRMRIPVHREHRFRSIVSSDSGRT